MKLFLVTLLLLAAGAALLAGCASGPALRAASGQEKGRGYFLRECGACHRHFWPQERAAAAWPAILARKKNKVSLTAHQFQQLSDYVLQAGSPAPGPP